MFMFSISSSSSSSSMSRIVVISIAIISISISLAISPEDGRDQAAGRHPEGRPQREEHQDHTLLILYC